MSVDATVATWKLQNVTATQKLILLSLADRADETGKCYPSIKRICNDTRLNRKTLIENRQILINLGYISYTGNFMGKMKQIPVMQLNYVKPREGKTDIEIVENFTSTEIGTGETFTSPDIGTGNQYRYRDTEPNINEPKIINNNINRDFIISKREDERFLRIKKEFGDLREDEDLLLQIKFVLDNRDKKYPVTTTLNNIEKFMKNGCFHVPKDYINPKEAIKITQVNEKREYDRLKDEEIRNKKHDEYFKNAEKLTLERQKDDKINNSGNLFSKALNNVKPGRCVNE